MRYKISLVSPGTLVTVLRELRSHYQDIEDYTTTVTTTPKALEVEVLEHIGEEPAEEARPVRRDY